ncbi:CGP-CTERM sorting domain-containing protein [Thermococcus sibiricus]|uniref:Endo-beta 1,4-glucanase (Extracellular) n=1 Tax=Thermococcus sibiricus (strain DSM 12597 / MM 739) TaxID=604354 RepID=C6A197_THESM|nr:CGP-CTERM sorting domain-containing protein [Thermococcus sibiricus]ACS89392.1 endo-beta 1,4-glucanase (extracellular) [Thermococcus sibiricus MM 739]
MSETLKKLLGVFMVLAVFAGMATAASLEDIKAVASTAEEGEIQFTWWDQWLEEPIQLSDGRTVWMQTNFWNIIGGQGEVFMRFVKATEDFAFYVNLENVETQWGGIAWATPEVIIDGRAPAQWWGDKAPVGGYDYLQLPLPASELSSYDSMWVKVKYDVSKRDDTLVRFGINIWFEDPATGAPIGEIYVPFFDDFGGIVGDVTEIGEVTSTVIINGELNTNAKFTVQRALSGGGWGVLLFMPQEPLPTSGEVVIDIKPMIDKVVEQLFDFFGMPVENQQWTSISIGSYSGSEGTSFEYGWIIYDATVLSPSEAPKIIKTTQTVTETKTITETKTTTKTEKVTETLTETETVTESAGGICGPAALLGLVMIPLVLRRKL